MQMCIRASPSLLLCGYELFIILYRIQTSMWNVLHYCSKTPLLEKSSIHFPGVDFFWTYVKMLQYHECIQHYWFIAAICNNDL